jgi:hypothetical protein
MAAPNGRNSASKSTVSANKGTQSASLGSGSKAGATVASISAPPVQNTASQKSRERDAKLILQTELEKTLQKRHVVAHEYAKTKDTKLKTELVRLAADEAGLRRELSRLSP